VPFGKLLTSHNEAAPNLGQSYAAAEQFAKGLQLLERHVRVQQSNN
jgi:hypothetical protein